MIASTVSLAGRIYEVRIVEIHTQGHRDNDIHLPRDHWSLLIKHIQTHARALKGTRLSHWFYSWTFTSPIAKLMAHI